VDKDQPVREWDAQAVREAPAEQIPLLLHEVREDILLALLDHPAFDETHLCLLLERRDLSAQILEEIARRKTFLANYRVKRALAAHPHTPRLVGMRLLRDLYLLDLVQLSLQPSVHAELRRQAEEQLIARLPQLPLGQKIMLARRGPGRLAGALLAEGQAQAVQGVLDNPFLTEGHVLKVLAGERVARVVFTALAHHPKWSRLEQVRLAMVRHRAAPLSVVLGLLPLIRLTDLKALAATGLLSEGLRGHIRREVERKQERPARKGDIL
jgi:hypothetical protein